MKWKLGSSLYRSGVERTGKIDLPTCHRPITYVVNILYNEVNTDLPINCSYQLQYFSTITRTTLCDISFGRRQKVSVYGVSRT